MTVSFILSSAVIVIGLVLFEVVSSVDNAIINAQILRTMSPKGRRWFLTWGLIFAVFVIRGLLPWLIVWMAIPDLGFIGSLTATFSGDSSIHEHIERQAPVLLIGGGIFLVYLWLHWFMVEDKNYGLGGFERFFSKTGMWFFAISSITLTALIILILNYGTNSTMFIGLGVGSSAYFIVHGFRKNAEEKEEKLLHDTSGSMNDFSKIVFLTVIDASFSIDGVLGAFAFTLSVPLILIGNGIGALVVRQLTISNIDRIANYPYLENGAMYSIGVLGLVMILESFKVGIPQLASPILTVVIIGFFFIKSVRAKRKKERESQG